MHLPRLHASVHWGALLHGRLVADFLFERPKLYVNLTQVRTEIREKTPMRERGWQEALESIYPLKINVFRVENAEITYVDQGPFRPLQLSRVNLQAENIRNVKSPDHVYPSEIHLDGVVFGSGKIVLDGKANFLAEPHIGVRAALSVERIPLDYFKPIMPLQCTRAGRNCFVYCQSRIRPEDKGCQPPRRLYPRSRNRIRA